MRGAAGGVGGQWCDTIYVGKFTLFSFWRLDCKEHARKKAVILQGSQLVQANVYHHWDRSGGRADGVKTDSLYMLSQHDLLQDIHLQLFLLLGCDSLWNQMFRIITVICEFLCIHTLLIWQSCYFFFSFPIHVYKYDSQAAWSNYFSGLEKRVKKL